MIIDIIGMKILNKKKNFQSECKNTSKTYPPWATKLHPRDAEKGQYKEISKCKPPVNKLKETKPHDHLIIEEKASDKLNIPYW